MDAFVETNLQEVDLNVGERGFHGDVIVTRLKKAPSDFEKWPLVKDDCLAYGEVTGHAHKLFGDFELRENPETKERVFVTKGNVTYLKHQEHNPRALLGEGRVYKHGIQREYDHFDELIREVAD